MDTTTQQTVDQVVASLNQVSGGLGNVAREMDNRAKAEKKLASELAGKTHRAAQSLNDFTQSSASAASLIGRMAVPGTLLGAFAGLVTVGNKLTQTYREMANNGSTFGGSLLTMAQTAASAGMPLEDFAKAVKSSGASVRILGEKGFAQFSKQVRKSMLQHGMYAMTLEQVNGLMGANMETNRRAGLVSTRNSAALAKNFVALAGTTSALSIVTGKAKDDIANLANSALQSSMSLSRIRTMGDKAGMEMSAKLQDAVTTMAAQQGAAGDFFTNALTETFGMGGRSEFSTQGQDLINAGMGNLASSLNKLSESPSTEGAINYMEEFRTEVGKNIPMLTTLAMSGNSSAKQLVAVHSEMIKMTKEDMKIARKKAETQDGLTKIFTSFGEWWNQIVGSFKEGFLKGLKPVFDSFGDFTRSTKLKKFASMIEGFGAAVGSAMGGFFKWVLDPSTLKKIGDKFGELGAWLSSIDWKAAAVGAAALVGGLALLAKVNFGILAAGLAGLAAFFGFLEPVLSPIISVMKEFPLATGAAIAAVWGLSKFFAGKALLESIFGKKTPLMTVNAAVVNVNGGGGFDGGGGGGGGGSKGRGSKWSRLKGAFGRRGIRGAAGMALGMGKRGVRNGISSIRAGGVGGLARGLLGGGLLSGGLEGLNYLLGDTALTGKNLGRSALKLGGGALGALAGGAVTGGMGGQFVGGVAGYSAGGKLADWMLGPEDSKAAIADKKKKAGSLAMTTAGAGLGAVAVNKAAETMGNGASKEEAPKTQEADPINSRLDKLIKSTEEGNAIRLAAAQSQTIILKDQSLSLNKIRRDG